MKNYLKALLYLLSVHATALAIQGVFRLVLLLAVNDQLTPDVSGTDAHSLCARSVV